MVRGLEVGSSPLEASSNSRRALPSDLARSGIFWGPHIRTTTNAPRASMVDQSKFSQFPGRVFHVLWFSPSFVLLD